MDPQLPVTTINGEPIEDVVSALAPLITALSKRIATIQRGEHADRIVLVPCLRNALVPIWIDLRQADGTDPPDLSPRDSFLMLIAAVGHLVDQVADAVHHNRSRAAA